MGEPVRIKDLAEQMIQTLENRIVELTEKLDQNHKSDNISNIK